MTDAQQAIDDPTPEQKRLVDEAVKACRKVANEDNPRCSVRSVLPDASVLITDFDLADGPSFTALDGEENLTPVERHYFDPETDNALADGSVIEPPFDTRIFKGA